MRPLCESLDLGQAVAGMPPHNPNRREIGARGWLGGSGARRSHSISSDLKGIMRAALSENHEMEPVTETLASSWRGLVVLTGNYNEQDHRRKSARAADCSKTATSTSTIIARLSSGDRGSAGSH